MKKLPSGNLSRDCSQSDWEKKYAKPKHGRTLICGSRVYGSKPDRRKRYPKALGVDMLSGPGVDRVIDLEAAPANLGQFAHIECLSMLEHSRRPWLVAATLERALVKEGTLFLTVPFVWRVHAYPSDYWRFTVQGVRELFPGIQWAELGYLHRSYAGKRIQGVEHKGFPVLPRTEVIGFGVRA